MVSVLPGQRFPKSLEYVWLYCIFLRNLHVMTVEEIYSLKYTWIMNNWTHKVNSKRLIKDSGEFPRS